MTQLATGIQSALNPQGPHAEAVATFGWVMFYGAAVVLAIVVACTAYALWAPKRARWMGQTRFVVWGGIAFPALVLTALFLYSLTLVGPVTAASEPPDLRVEVISHQWWWRIRYLDAQGRAEFETANEIRLPAGRTVELILKSADVIHSFWVPTLAGKVDMIPGHVNRLRITAANEGTFRGQCAEYCGGPHALMALFVVSHAPPEFERWREAQRADAADPSTDSAVRGRDLFVQHCASCHTIRGTPAQGALGPDLTHFGSRLTLGAGLLTMNERNTAAWIASSQHLKPENLMPSMNVFGKHELHALAEYVVALR